LIIKKILNFLIKEREQEAQESAMKGPVGKGARVEEEVIEQRAVVGSRESMTINYTESFKRDGQGKSERNSE
jgi:hypothetical protein